MERFLRYSLEKGQRIRLIYQTEEGGMKMVNAQVTAIGERTVRMVTVRPRPEMELPLERILSADYRRGDEGQA